MGRRVLRIISSCINIWTSQRPRKRSSVTAPHSITHSAYSYARTAFWTRNHNLHRPHRSCPIHRRTTCNMRIWAGFQHWPIGPAASARNRGWAARSRFTSRSILSRTPLRQKDHDNVCDLSPPPPPRRCELAGRRPRCRLEISAARTPRRLQTASTARFLPDNDRASHQSSVPRARVSPLTPRRPQRRFNPKEPGPAPGSLLFGDIQWLTINADRGSANHPQ